MSNSSCPTGQIRWGMGPVCRPDWPHSLAPLTGASAQGWSDMETSSSTCPGSAVCTACNAWWLQSRAHMQSWHRACTAKGVHAGLALHTGSGAQSWSAAQSKPVLKLVCSTGLVVCCMQHAPQTAPCAPCSIHTWSSPVCHMQYMQAPVLVLHYIWYIGLVQDTHFMHQLCWTSPWTSPMSWLWHTVPDPDWHRCCV